MFGFGVLIDCHSMPRLSRSGDRLAPDIVLGDRYGTTCSPALADLVEMVFAGAGLRVARNRPYAGGFCTRSYGRPQHGVHAIQMELAQITHLATEAPPFAYDAGKAEVLRRHLKDILTSIEAIALELKR